MACDGCDDVATGQWAIGLRITRRRPQTYSLAPIASSSVVNCTPPILKGRIFIRPFSCPQNARFGAVPGICLLRALSCSNTGPLRIAQQQSLAVLQKFVQVRLDDGDHDRELQALIVMHGDIAEANHMLEALCQRRADPAALR